MLLMFTFKINNLVVYLIEFVVMMTMPLVQHTYKRNAHFVIALPISITILLTNYGVELDDTRTHNNNNKNNNNSDNKNNRSMFISIQFCSNYRTETNALLTETVFRCQCNVNKFRCICWLRFKIESATENLNRYA